MKVPSTCTRRCRLNKEVEYPHMVHPDHTVYSPSDTGGEYTAFVYSYIRALIQAVDRPS